MQRLIGSGDTLQLYNIYGISEVSSWASLQSVDLSSQDELSTTSDDNHHSASSVASDVNRQLRKQLCHQHVSIGDPLSDTVIELRSEEGEHISDGFGEIWIGELLIYLHQFVPFNLELRTTSFES